LITWFVAGLSRTVRQRDAQLAQARERHLENDRLVALGIQAANAAHEIGTPLSTVAIIAGELLHDIDRAAGTGGGAHAALGDYRQEFATIEAQIALCRAALERMGKRGANSDDATEEVSVAPWLTQFADEWRLRYPATRLAVALPAVDARVASAGSLAHILTNLLDNAAQAVAASDAAVRLEMHIQADRVRLEVIDQGPGIAAEVLPLLGCEPIGNRAAGHGIGLFLAFATAHRIGASIRFFPNPGGGTRACLTVPLA
jgi:two-component system sensor histidine kinase RegB